MIEASLDLASASKALCRSLLEKTQPVPGDTLFRNDIFKTICENIHNKNEARVILDIHRLIVPSAEILAAFGAKHLNILTESVNEGWNSSISFTNTRPQPDYSVGFKRNAFTKDQLAKLSPFISNFIAGDQSFFMATYLITGEDISYYRHLICVFSFIELDGKDKWTAYQFTRNLYDIWVPKHFENICSAIDQLPSNLDFDVPTTF
ncbi:hypothetical protein QC762_0054250 [Podospora pseudocomata]|uniref:DUF7924 domain-containing protein n=1 Tax=Podospora pseudocomata TaxID=2093779 RepID=A0ABR0GJK7_9PEZI|nr:hypothetical protein QC762_0054250 [Podospora pseudocomata]